MNYKIIVQYDGSRYDGWQKQGNSERTIQEKLERVFCRMTGETIEIQGAGRTDAGVHARGQTANFHCASVLKEEEIIRYANCYLPDDIAVVSAEIVPERFHARLNATGKVYRYTVRNSPVPDVFSRKQEYQLAEPLDLDAMRRGAKLLEGTHDFKSFCSIRRSKKSTVRTLYDVSVQREGDTILFLWHGNGFLYHMVRILTGTLLEVGLGKRSPEEMTAILEGRNRELAGMTAPAQGLCLIQVEYESREETASAALRRITAQNKKGMRGERHGDLL